MSVDEGQQITRAARIGGRAVSRRHPGAARSHPRPPGVPGHRQDAGFLRFVVEETLAGREHRLKGYTIATRVFGRGDDFDAAQDPIVSIQAGRLRRALERYYLVAGGRDPVFIDIPKGRYVPRFRAQTAAPDRRRLGLIDGRRCERLSRRPGRSVAVVPLEISPLTPNSASSQSAWPRNWSPS